MLAQHVSDKTIVIAVTVIGIAVCSIGIGQVAAQNAWAQPLSIVAYFVGALVLIIAAAALFNLSLPFIPDARAAWIAILVLALVKVALTQLHRALA